MFGIEIAQKLIRILIRLRRRKKCIALELIPRRSISTLDHGKYPALTAAKMRMRNSFWLISEQRLFCNRLIVFVRSSTSEGGKL